MTVFRCASCSHSFESDELDVSCEMCGSPVVSAEGCSRVPSRDELESLPAGVWRYKAFLPSLASGESVSLGEGGTPLLRARRLGSQIGVRDLLIKDECRNPTGSFIDRGSTVLVSLAKERSVRRCSCLTTGNLGASLAAYCAKAGIPTSVTIHPSTDRGKLYQMLAYGADVEASQQRAGTRQSRAGSLSVTAANPYLLEGEKTTCFEIVQDLSWRPPDVIVVPVGTGGHLSMIWRALKQLGDAGLAEPAGCRLLGVSFEPKLAGGSAMESPFTELEDSEPFFKKEASRAMKESGGEGLTTAASQTVKATGLLARSEGIFAEPASASVVSALESAVSTGLVGRDEVVVCVITGSGLKDTKAVARLAREAKRVPVREDYPVTRIQVGETKLGILNMLSRGSNYGYELWQGLSRSRRITTASIYQHLGELESLGLVHRSGLSRAGGRERVLYELTARGRNALKLAGKLD